MLKSSNAKVQTAKAVFRNPSGNTEPEPGTPVAGSARIGIVEPSLDYDVGQLHASAQSGDDLIVRVPAHLAGEVVPAAARILALAPLLALALTLSPSCSSEPSGQSCQRESKR